MLSRLRGDAAVAAVFETTVQPFNHTFQQTRNISLTANTGPGGTSEPIRVVSPMYNTNTPLPGGITAPLLDTPVDDERGGHLMAFDLRPLPD